MDSKRGKDGMRKNPFQALRLLCAASVDYLKRDADTVRDLNYRSLVRVGVAYTLLLAGYAAAAHFLFQSMALDWFYIGFLAAQLALDYGIARLARLHGGAFAQVQRLCGLQAAAIMAFIIGISVVPFPDRPAVFFAPVLISMNMLFVFPFRKMCYANLAATGAFLLLAYARKTAGAFVYDIWAALPSLLISLFCAYTLSDLRIRDFRSRWRWMLLARLDQFTRLYNKATAESLFQARLSSAAPREAQALLLLDVDNFKALNDAYGHAQGDAILLELAETLRNCQAPMDICGRFGGDEFMVLMGGLSSAQAAQERAACLLKALNGRFAQRFPGASITCSAGVAFGPAQAGYEKLFACADSALYAAKGRGKGKWQLLEIQPDP